MTGVILPLAVMLLWGSLFPMIKLGYRALDINSGSTAEILMFAAMRFVVCGVVVCIFAAFKSERAKMPGSGEVFALCLMGLFAIVLHYGFTYLGLSVTDSSKTAILKQFAPLLYSCVAFAFERDGRFSPLKIVGALIGFSGIAAINGGVSLKSFGTGELLILAASVCTVISMILSAKSAKSLPPLWITGISQLFGGVVLLAVSFALGGRIHELNLKAAMIFAYICVASIVGYTLFYYVQKTVPLSRLFIIKFAEPLFACVLGALLLGENIFRFRYLVAFVLISLGIVICNIDRSKNV